MDLQSQVRGTTDSSLSHKVIAVLMSLILAFGLSPLGQSPAAAYADEGTTEEGSSEVGNDIDASKVVAAPVVKRSSDGATVVGDATTESGIKATVTDDGSSTEGKVTVKLEAEALPKHHNAESAYAYWAGIGVPFSEGYEFASGLGDYVAEDAEFGAPDSTFPVKGEDGKETTYSSLYFGSHVPWGADDKGYVAVKAKKTEDAEEAADTLAALYVVDLSGVKCAGDAVAAPLTAEFQPKDYAIGQVVSEGADQVTFTATGALKKHVRGDGGSEVAYWVGLGLPWTDDRALQVGYGEYSDGAEKSADGKATNDYTPEGSTVSYTTVYLDNARVRAEGAWVRVMKKSDPSAVLAVYRVGSSIDNSSTVTVADDVAAGTVTVASGLDSDGFVTQGQTVKLSATPEEGYKFSEWVVTDSKGEKVAVSEVGEFTMPASDVTVSATFEEIVKAPAVAAPLVDHADTTETPVNGGFAISEQSQADGKTTVKLNASSLAKHRNADGAYAYWAGIGVPFAGSDYTFATNYTGDFSSATYEAAETTYTPDSSDTEYSTFYFGTYRPTLPSKTGYISVKRGEDVVATYVIDFSGITCAGDAVVAPLNDHGAPDATDQNTDMNPAGYTLSESTITTEGVDTVTLAGTALQKHYNAQHAEAYWVGIGVPYANGETVELGYGPYSSSDTGEPVTGNAEADFEVNGTQYTSAYYDNAKIQANGGAWLRVKDAEGTVVAAYQVGTNVTNAIAAPEAKANLQYTGHEQTGVDEGDGYALEGATGTNAGNYTATATLKDGYVWSDETDAAKSISWSIAKASGTLEVADTLTLKCGAEGVIEPGNVQGSLTATSSDTDKATVEVKDNKVVVKPIAVTAPDAPVAITITDAGNDNYSSVDKQVSVTIEKGVTTIKLPDWSTEFTGGALTYGGQPEVTGSGANIEYKYYTDAECTADVTEVKEYGTYYVTGTIDGDANYEGATSAPAKFKVTKKQLKEAWFDQISAKTYDGSQIKPEVSTKSGTDGASLKLGTDYQVAYASNKDAGTNGGCVVVTGKGIYGGSVLLRFNIEPASLDDDMISVEESYDYTGAAIEPATVEFNGSVLTPGVDYIASYEDNETPGTATVTVSGLGGNFIGSADKTFNIVANNEIEVTAKSVPELTYSGDKAQVVKASDAFSVAGAFGIVVYSLAANDANIEIDSETGDLTVPAGTKAGSYIVNVTAKATDAVTAADGTAKELTATGSGDVTVKVVEAANPIKVASNTQWLRATYNADSQVIATQGTAENGAAYTVTKAQDDMVTYMKSMGPDSIEVDEATGNITAAAGLPVGSYYVGVVAYAQGVDGCYDAGMGQTAFFVKVSRAESGMTVTPGSPATTYSTANQTVAASKLATVKGNSGTVTYAKTSGDDNITVAGNGKVTVNKKLAAGSYPLTVEVTDPGDKNHAPKTEPINVTLTVNQAANMATAAKTSVTSTQKVANLKKKAGTVALPKVTTKFGTAAWKVSTSDKKGVLTLKSGKVQVKKGAKVGKYTLKLKASVTATKNYKAATTKVVTVTVTVKK